jgi:hypothetical protein
MSTSISNLGSSPTARKVVGSLGVIGAAAAVAGLGTLGSFTDSSTPANTTISTATLDIDAAAVGESIPVTTAGFVPGDSLTRAVDLVNKGTAALGSVSLNTTAGTSSILTTDVVNGLQLTVTSCSVPWTQGGTAGAPTYSCTGTTQVLGSGPAVSNISLTDPASLAPGGKDHLTFAITLPTSADNSFQGLSADLGLTFVGTQRTGTAR